MKAVANLAYFSIRIEGLAYVAFTRVLRPYATYISYIYIYINMCVYIYICMYTPWYNYICILCSISILASISAPSSTKSPISRDFHRASFQRSQLLVQRRCKDLIAKARLPGAHEEDAMPGDQHVAGDLNWLNWVGAPFTRAFSWWVCNSNNYSLWYANNHSYWGYFNQLITGGDHIVDTLILDPCLIVGYSGYGSKSAMDPSLAYGSWVCFRRLRKFGRSHMHGVYLVVSLCHALNTLNFHTEKRQLSSVFPCFCQRHAHLCSRQSGRRLQQPWIIFLEPSGNHNPRQGQAINK